MGIIDIKKGLTLNYLSNDFKKDKAYYEFIDCIKEAMKNVSNQRQSKRARISSEDAKF